MANRMEKDRIAIARPGKHFGVRVSGLAVRDGYVLLHRSELDDFWSPAGGGCELLETSEQALRREMREEMGLDVRVERLLWVVEHFFPNDDVACHEIGFVYLIDVGDAYGPAIRPNFVGVEGPLALFFRWFRIAELEKERIYPTFLPAALRDIPQRVAHIVHRQPLLPPKERAAGRRTAG